MIKKTAILFLITIALAGCKTQIAHLQQDPSFTYEAMTQHQLVVGGVVSMVDPEQSVLERVRLGEMLSRAFKAERGELQLISSGYLLKKLGSQDLAILQDSYQFTGTVEPSDVEHIRQLIPDARFLILCRIESNHISQDHQKTETPVADSAEDEKKGEYEHLRVEVTLTTSREVSASLLIYDLELQRQVWSGFLKQTKSNKNSSSNTIDNDQNWVEQIVGSMFEAMINQDDMSYPEAPSVDRVLEGIFEGFAENMPERRR